MNTHNNLVYYADLNARNESGRIVFSPEIKFPESSIYRRNKAIRWINVITALSGCDVDTKHTCIQIFDRYMISSFLEENASSENSNFLSLTAAAAALIGTKIHDSKRALSVESFPYFKVHDLVNCERLILEKINYDIDPLQSPASFMKIMLDIWPGCVHRHNEIFREACDLVDAFWMTFESVQYSPMTIAVSALLLTFSKLKIDSSDWLRFLPSRCLTPIDGTGYRAIDRCLVSFRVCNQKSTGVSEFEGSNNSPTTVTAMIESKLNIKSIPLPSITPTNTSVMGGQEVHGDTNSNDSYSNSSDENSSSSGSSSETTNLIFSPIKSNLPQHNLVRVELKRPVPVALSTQSSAGKKRRRNSRTDF